MYKTNYLCGRESYKSLSNHPNPQPNEKVSARRKGASSTRMI